MHELTVGSLFAGIGGFDLGLERAGMRVIWQSEIDPYASAVLRRNWPAVPNLGDIRGITADRLRAMGDADVNDGRSRGAGRPDSASAGEQFTKRAFPFPDVLCGGFPCQDISNAGKRAGIDGERSGLWSEYARVIGELRPRYVIVENVAALLGRGLERVLGDLAALGFDAEWHCIPASAVGAPHRRDRLWIVAHSEGSGRKESRSNKLQAGTNDALGDTNSGAHVAHAGSGRGRGRDGEHAQRRACVGNGGEDVAHANLPRLEGRLRASLRECAGERVAGEGGALADSGRGGWEVSLQQPGNGREAPGERQASGVGMRGASDIGTGWLSEPDVGRVAHGVPSRVDRLRCLGNAIVPQIAEIIGRAIVARENEHA